MVSSHWLPVSCSADETGCKSCSHLWVKMIVCRQ